MRRALFCLALLAIIASAFPPNAPAGQCVTKGGYVFAANKELLDKAVRFLAQKDNDAFMALAKTGLVGVLKPGVPVFVEDSSLLSGTVKFRPKGSTGSVWAVREGVDCKQN